LLKILSRLLYTDLHPPSGADEVCGHGSSKIYTHHQELMKFEGSSKSLLFMTKVMVTTLCMIGAQLFPFEFLRGEIFIFFKSMFFVV
jgi:hypothetical protein